jgi:hypothetical protein
LSIDTQADEFSQFNTGKLLTDPEWWAFWEAWCRQAVDYARHQG